MHGAVRLASLQSVTAPGRAPPSSSAALAAVRVDEHAQVGGLDVQERVEEHAVHVEGDAVDGAR